MRKLLLVHERKLETYYGVIEFYKGFHDSNVNVDTE